MTNEITTLQFNNDQFGQLRVVKDDNGEPWFVAQDVCDALCIGNVSQSLNRLDDDEKNTIILNDGIPGNPSKAVVNEPGLYSLVLSSRKPEAKAFKRWVTHEVLPSIRKKGGYIAAAADETPEQIMARAVLLAQDTIERQKAQIEELKPKALFADAVAASDGTCLVGELAKMMRQNGVQIGQNRLFEKLRQDGYLGKTGSNYNVPTQRAMEMGLFRIKETSITHSDGHITVQRTAKVTGKGQQYFINRFIKAAR
jgi:anti-repressor protein